MNPNLNQRDHVALDHVALSPPHPVPGAPPFRANCPMDSAGIERLEEGGGGPPPFNFFYPKSILPSTSKSKGTQGLMLGDRAAKVLLNVRSWDPRSPAWLPGDLSIQTKGHNGAKRRTHLVLPLVLPFLDTFCFRAHVPTLEFGLFFGFVQIRPEQISDNFDTHFPAFLQKHMLEP